MDKVRICKTLEKCYDLKQYHLELGHSKNNFGYFENKIKWLQYNLKNEIDTKNIIL